MLKEEKKGCLKTKFFFFLRAPNGLILSKEVDGALKPEAHSVEVFSRWSSSSSVNWFISPPSF